MREDPIKRFFIWPAVIVVLLVSIFPLIYSLTTSFMSFRLVPPTPPRFVGLDNSWNLLQQPCFWAVVRTTTLIAFVSVALPRLRADARRLARHPRRHPRPVLPHLHQFASRQLPGGRGPHTLLIGHVGPAPFTAQVSAHTAVAPDDTVSIPLDLGRR